jgi:hypothetical protein
MTDHEIEQDVPAHETGDDELLREAQEDKGYGQDEGEREAGLEEETSPSRGDPSGDEPAEPDTA